MSEIFFECMEPGERVRSENWENWKISSGSEEEEEEENIQNKKTKNDDVLD